MEREERALADQITYSAAHQDLSQPFRPNVSSYEGNERQQEGSNEMLTEEEKIELERDQIRREAEERFRRKMMQEAETFKNHEKQAQKSLERFKKANPDSKSPTAEFEKKKKHNNNDESVLSSENPLRDDFSQKFFPSAAPGIPGFGPGGSPNSAETSAFTGEDERFAYKRAVSRIREMTGSPRWVQSVCWTPLDNESRPWETFDETGPLPDSYFFGKPEQEASDANATSSLKNGDIIPDVNLKDTTSGYTSPFRKNKTSAPKLNAKDLWSKVAWGPGNDLKNK